jgi:hypothetical protein
MLKMFALQSGALIAEIYAMFASKTRPAVSAHGGFMAVEKSGDTIDLSGDVPFGAPHDLPLALALGCVPGE